MPEQIIDATGQGYGMVVNQDGSINISGVDISIGSLAIALENVYVTSGNVAIVDETPTADNKNNPFYRFVYMRSGTDTNVTGSSIGSVIQFIDAGSYVSAWTYSNNNLVDIGSYI